jgi:hypothetical protein
LCWSQLFLLDYILGWLRGMGLRSDSRINPMITIVNDTFAVNETTLIQEDKQW